MIEEATELALYLAAIDSNFGQEAHATYRLIISDYQSILNPTKYMV